MGAIIQEEANGLSIQEEANGLRIQEGSLFDGRSIEGKPLWAYVYRKELLWA